MKTILENGVYVASLTPLDSLGNPDVQLLARHCHSLLEQGAQGIALLGTTGEANSFSATERMDLLENLLQADIPAQKILLGTGCCSYPETLELTRHALSCGVNNILMLPPFYYKQVNDEGLFLYFRKVLDALSAPALQVYLYHIPKMTGVSLTISLIGKLREAYPDEIVGIKDSGGNWEHMSNLCHTFPGFRVFAGTEKYLLPVLRAGGAGCISATANITIHQCRELFQKWTTPEADEIQEELTAQRDIFEGYSFTSILKQALAVQSQEKQWLNMRPPLSSVPETDVFQVLQKMKKHQLMS